MDQGDAAVWAGVAGLIGAGVGSWIAGFFSVRSAKEASRSAVEAAERAGDAAVEAAIEGAVRAGEAAVRQVELQAEVARADWLLQHRLNACLGVMEAYDRYAEQARPYFEALLVGEQSRADLQARAEASQLAVTQAYFRVRAFGSEPLRQAALAVRVAVEGAQRALDGWDVYLLSGATDSDGRQEQRADERTEAMGEAHADFVAVVGQIVTSGGDGRP